MITMGYDFAIESGDTYPTVIKDAPLIDAHFDEMIIKLVKNSSGQVTGVQLSNDNAILLSKRFLNPLVND